MLLEKASAQTYQPLTDIGSVANQLIVKNGPELGTGLGELITQIFFVVLAIAVVLAIFSIIRGGYLYITSSDNYSKKQEAKNKIWAAFGGLLLAFGTVLILGTINRGLTEFTLFFRPLKPPTEVTFTNDEAAGLSEEELDKKVSEILSKEGEKDAEGKIPWTQEREDAVRAALAGMGVIPKAGSGVEVGGLQQSTIDGLRQLLNEAGVSSSDRVTLTGGSEDHIHASGAKSHHTGYKLDFRTGVRGDSTEGDKKLHTYFENKLGPNNSLKTTNLSNGQRITIYRHGAGSNDHWDIKLH